jgi:catechol 2,3-dioxygenase-like lactoylglutathione lyase family enzyme
MITGIDHAVIGAYDFDAAIGAYERLLDRRVSHTYENDGVATALIVTGNMMIEIMTPRGDGVMAQRLRTAIDASGEGLISLAFAVSDIEAAHRRMERVGLAPDAISDGEAGALRWRRFRANSDAVNGVRLFFIERDAPLRDDAQSGVPGLDHLVIRTNDIEQAAALYGARLGLDMRLDRQIGDRRLMFFRCGDLVVEIVEDRQHADRLWGLSWRVRDAAREQARLAALGLDVSEVRTGMKPGTRVFTVRDQTGGAPTLMIEASQTRD